MATLPLTFGRAMKVWWSYMWRGMLLSVPVVAFVQVPAMFVVIRRFRAQVQPGQPIDPRTAFAPGAFRFLVALWIVMAVVMMLVQTQALRWALRTKWADFRLVAVDPSNRDDVPSAGM